MSASVDPAAVNATLTTPRPPRTRVAMTVALMVAVTLGGCGGDSDEATDPPIRIERDEQLTIGTTEADAADPVDEGPIVDGGLADRLIAVDGYTFVPVDPPAVGYYQELKLPPKAPLARFAVESDGATIDVLTLVGAPEGVNPSEFEDDVVDRFFDGSVSIVRDVEATETGTFVVTNDFAPEWVALGDEFAMQAVNDIDDQARWQWFWDDLLWIVEGTGATRAIAEDLVAAQHALAPPDPYDTHLIAGELVERFADLPGYWYWDQPRDGLLDNIDNAAARTCQAQWLLVVVGEGPREPIGNNYLFVEMAVLGNFCDGFEEDFRSFVLGLPGGRTQTVGGLDAIVADTAVAWIEDGVLVAIDLIDPANFDRFQPFITGFAQHHAALPVPE